MERITDYCTGCRACEQLCAKNAISMVPDKEGFLTAQIDADKCVDCGLCQKRCPQNQVIGKNAPKKVIAVRLKDEDVLYRSASGGAFAGIAKAWIEDGGIVAGVTYDGEWNAHHVFATTLEELKAIQSSKYVQADTSQSFSEVKRLLTEGKKVLFSGTACQIGGLKAFLKKDYDNLLTMDLICHGVSSPLLFRKYIEWLGDKCGSPIKEYDFRDKKGGWGLGYKYKYKYKYKYGSCSIDPYYSRFLAGDTYREACYQCKYCTPERVGDITIGDYWGIEKEHPKFFSTKGVSCVLVNTDKGINAWNSSASLFYTLESEFERVARHNGNLLHPTVRKNDVRDSIYLGINEENWFADKFAGSFRPSLMAKVKNLMPMWVRLIIKKIK